MQHCVSHPNDGVDGADRSGESASPLSLFLFQQYLNSPLLTHPRTSTHTYPQHAANMMSPNTNPKPVSIPDASNMLSPRNEMNAMHATEKIHMHQSNTNLHPKRTIASPETTATMKTMDCTMNADGIMACAPRVPSPEAKSSMHEKRMKAGTMMSSDDGTAEKKTAMDAVDMGNVASGVLVRRMMDNGEVVESKAMAGVGHSDAADAHSARLIDTAMSEDY